METIANFPDLATAHVAAAMLAAEGIDASIPDEHVAGLDWRMATALQGIRLQVGPDDAQRATELLTQEPDPVEIENPVAGEDVCPRCQSPFIAPARWRVRLKAATMIIPTLLLVWPFVLAIRRRVKCSNCGHRWREPDSSAAPNPH
jgi:hypothetical protein